MYYDGDLSITKKFDKLIDIMIWLVIGFIIIVLIGSIIIKDILLVVICLILGISLICRFVILGRVNNKLKEWKIKDKVSERKKSEVPLRINRGKYIRLK